MARLMTPPPTLMKWAVAATCGYEVAAIATGRIPTLTMLADRHRWIAPILVAALAVHLLLPSRTAEFASTAAARPRRR
jgi:hypothetical protein